MRSVTFAMSTASIFLAAACGGSSAPAESTMPANESTAPMHDGAAANGTMPTPTGEQVKCMGINECKGTAACNIAGGHSCAGQNECKGKGWVLIGSADACTAKGGTVPG